MTFQGERRFRAGLVQLRSGRAVEPNLDMAEALIRRAAKGGAAYVQTPENTAIMELKPELVIAASEAEGKSVPLARLKALAAELGIFLHIGSLAIKLDQERVANRSYVIDPQGGIAARYDKLHMFDVDLAGGESYRESQYFRPGAKAVLADLPFGRLGLSICYDLRFPAPSRRPLPNRRARPIGRSWRARAPSRPAPSCSPPPKEAGMRTAAALMATAWSYRLGARSWQRAARSRA